MVFTLLCDQKNPLIDVFRAQGNPEQMLIQGRNQLDLCIQNHGAWSYMLAGLEKGNVGEREISESMTAAVEYGIRIMP